MDELNKLSAAVDSLHEKISEFPIGAVSFEDFKPTEEKIKDTRELLKALNAKLLMLQCRRDTALDSTEKVVEEEIGQKIERLHEALTNSFINNKTVELSLHSSAVIEIISEGHEFPALQKKTEEYMQKIFSLNDKVYSIQESLQKALTQQIEAKIEFWKAIYAYQDFLKEQQELRDEKLQKTNPEIAKSKNKMERTLRKINLMKKLITNLVATSEYLIKDNPVLVQMLKDHCDPVSIETILEMCHARDSNT
ncbi:uncharacterized protein LOC107271227 [Cephus cinctus]|uniref:Uncharacterized protein LOC107271227 n=1 Tax=Cephus cinctus TaxID=211228 RepID=A0AAJ7RNL6_CEPCN|nr:uncharacterized protein LOC107271227 [Cephus cinctus]